MAMNQIENDLILEKVISIMSKNRYIWEDYSIDKYIVLWGPR